MFKFSGFWFILSSLLSSSNEVKEYDQWKDPQEFYSDDYFLRKKGVATPHEI